MKPETAKLIREATDALRLRDIVLFESRLMRENSPPDVEALDALQQHKRGVKFAVGEPGGDQDATRELHVIVSLGERVVDNVAAEDPKIYFAIEADYLVIYDMVGNVSEEALKAFSELNSVHNVWPFWRQHVFDLVAQARLPALQVPLFSGAEL
jgi:hypothetical protein